jgi:hypothetical protein
VSRYTQDQNFKDNFMESKTSTGAASVTEKTIRAAADRLVNEWVFPGGTCHTPDAITMAQSSILASMLRVRMTELASAGIDPLGQSISELLPDVVPHEIRVYADDDDPEYAQNP